MRRITILTATLCGGVLGAWAQMVPLVGDNLYFNADRVWSYNLYEQSRWGGGLRWTAAPAWAGGNRLTADAYVGYGYLDRQWKWGVSIAASFARSRHSLGAHASVLQDLIPAGSRSLTATTLADLSTLSSFMNRRMASALQLTGGVSWRWKKMRHLAEVHAHNGKILFSDTRLLYPADGDICPSYSDYGLRWTGRHDAGLSAELQGGYNRRPSDRPYLRLLLQYNRSFVIKPFTLSLFGQAGALAPGARGSYMQAFDLGGTYGAPLFFERSLLTARPGEFTADRFICLSVMLRVKEPLFVWMNKVLMLGTAPRPFVRVGGAVGAIDADYYADVEHLGSLRAPSQGIAEGAAGIEGLVRWGAVDWGVAAAYRLTPASASYHLDNAADNLQLLFTATLYM